MESVYQLEDNKKLKHEARYCRPPVLNIRQSPQNRKWEVLSLKKLDLNSAKFKIIWEPKFIRGVVLKSA